MTFLKKHWFDLALIVGGIVLGVVATMGVLDFRREQRAAATPPAEMAAPPAAGQVELTAQVGTAELEAQIRASIKAVANYLARNQLSNGELPYQVFVDTGNRGASPSMIRLVAGTGSLYTACRVLGDGAYCAAGDRALDHYRANLIAGDHYDGLCLYASGVCTAGGDALAIDAIYKRWQATGSTMLGDTDLMSLAVALGDNIVWAKRDEGGLYHAFDPFPGGTVDEEYFVTYFNGESLMALLELYEMTGDGRWLAEARALNAYMLTREITQDHWHGYAFRLFALLDELTQADADYATRIAATIIADQTDLLSLEHSSISTATKVEALAGIAIAFDRAGQPHDWLAPEIAKFAEFVMARQLPANLCGWEAGDVARYEGGIYRNCEDPYIRVDAQQHWMNGAATYLEYLERITQGEGST